MSFAKSSSSCAITEDIPKAKKTVGFVKKSVSSIPLKSRIPRQEKLTSPVLKKETSKVNVSTDKQNDKLSTPPKSPNQPSSETPSIDTPATKPSTPPRLPRSKSQEKSSVINRIPKNIIWTGPEANERRVLENQFNQKKIRYLTSMREIEDKQNVLVTSMLQLLQLREKILNLGGKDPGQLEEYNPLYSWSLKAKSSGGNEEEAVDESLVDYLDKHCTAITNESYTFCRKAIDKYNDIIAWLTNFEREFWNDPSLANCKEEMIQQSNIYKQECSTFEKKLKSIHSDQALQTKELALRLGLMWQECVKYRMQVIGADLSVTPDLFSDKDKLRVEKEKATKLLAKLRKQETALATAEKKLKQVEDSVKEKDVLIESKDKELSKIHKSYESTILKGEKQKATFESRLIKLKEELEFNKNEMRLMTNSYTENIDNLRNELEIEKKNREELEYQFNELKQRSAKLEEKSRELLKHETKKKGGSIITEDKHHTEYEIQLFMELKEAKTQLAEKDKQIQKLQTEKKEITEVISQDTEKSNANKELTANIILKKTEELDELKSHFTQLQKNYKRAQQKAYDLEKLINANTMQVRNGSKNFYAMRAMQLQQEVADLRSNLHDAEAQNEGLEKNYVLLQLKLEHFKRYLKYQEKDSNIRKEIQQLLRFTDEEYTGDAEQGTFATIKSDELQKLYQILESKETQLLKLKKLLKQMERQEQSLQNQRTQFEKRIATLEIALKKEQQGHRNRGFSFL